MMSVVTVADAKAMKNKPFFINYNCCILLYTEPERNNKSIISLYYSKTVSVTPLPPPPQKKKKPKEFKKAK